MNIADLFFGFRGDGARLQKDAQVEGAKAGTIGGNSFAGSFKKAFSGANIGKGLIQGLGLAGALGAVNLVSRAVSTFTDVLQDSVKAALEDQASVSRLGASLKANIPNWDGNTTAIERVIKARMNLGFADEEQRDSLARLVVATKDVNQALAIQRTAMDLARLKNISLADASDALVRVEAGQYRGLKALGIQLKAGATQTEALAAVTAVAAGQAEAYANTVEGKMLRAQIKINESMEAFGYRVLPIVSDALENVLFAFDKTTVSFKEFQDRAAKGDGGARQTLSLLKEASEATGASIEDLWQVAQDQNLDLATARIKDFKKALTDSRNESTTAAEKIKGGLGIIQNSAGLVGRAAFDMQGDVKDATESVISTWDRMTKALADSTQKLIDDAFDPIITQDRLIANEADISAQRRIIASSTSSKAEIADARARLHELKKDNLEYLVSLAEAGKTNSGAFKNGLAELKAAIKAAKGPAKAALQEILDKILEIEKAGKVVPINIRISSKTTSGLGPGGKAAGGPVSAGIPYLVGERGPEIVVPRTASTVLTNAQSRGALAGMGAAAYYDQTTVNIGRLESNGPSDIAFELRRLAVTKSMLPKPWRPR